MDPDANLREQLELVEKINAARDSAAEDTGDLSPDIEQAVIDHAFRLAELVEALNGWMTRGVRAPVAWGIPTRSDY